MLLLPAVLLLSWVSCLGLTFLVSISTFNLHKRVLQFKFIGTLAISLKGIFYHHNKKLVKNFLQLAFSEESGCSLQKALQRSCQALLKKVCRRRSFSLPWMLIVQTRESPFSQPYAFIYRHAFVDVGLNQIPSVHIFTSILAPFTFDESLLYKHLSHAHHDHVRVFYPGTWC